MVDHMDIEELCHRLDLLGQLFVGPAGLELSGGVVVCEDDPHGQRLEHNGKEDADIHQGARDAPMGERIDALALIPRWCFRPTIGSRSLPPR